MIPIELDAWRIERDGVSTAYTPATVTVHATARHDCFRLDWIRIKPLSALRHDLGTAFGDIYGDDLRRRFRALYGRGNLLTRMFIAVHECPELREAIHEAMAAKPPRRRAM